MRLSPTILLAMAIAGAAAAPADAANRCAALRAELAALGRGGLPSDRYRVSADRQRDALARAQTMARRCGGSAAALPACRDLTDTIARMRANLASLEAMARRGGGASGTRRAEIRAQLSEAGCQAPARAAPPKKAAPAPERRAARLRPAKPARSPVTEAALRPSMLPAQKPAMPPATPPIPAVAPAPPFDRSLLAHFPANASYRTLCVRTCDGYYFPMSWSVTRSAFEGDAAACAKACPGSPTVLYVQPAGAEPDQSQSLDGRPYKDLPMAYRYRTERVPACGCEAAAAAEDSAPEPAPDAAPAVAMPDAGGAPIQDWQIPDGDRSTVPAPAEDGSQSLNVEDPAATPVAFSTRRFPANTAAVEPVAAPDPARRIWPAVHTQ